MNNTLDVFSTYGRSGGSSRVRLFDWLDFLNIENVGVHDYLGTSDNSIKVIRKNLLQTVNAERALRSILHGGKIQRALISRQASPFSSGGIEKKILRSSELAVYDFDDALMHYPPSVKDIFGSKRRVWAQAVAAADIVIAGNAYLAEHAHSLNTNTVIIPSCVNPEQYPVKEDYEIQDHPVAVWIGSPSTEAYLTLIEGALIEVHQSTGLRLKLISAGSRSLGRLDSIIDRVDWSLDTYGEQIREADFGIMPLKDNLWARGKCAYKLLQYGAAALPLVGNPVGANKDVLAMSEGFSVTTESEWVDAMTTLIANMSSTQRKSVGAKARETVQKHYSFQAWSGAWSSTLSL